MCIRDSIDTLISAYDRMEALGFYNSADDLSRGYLLLQAKKPLREKADKFFQSGIKATGAATDEWYISYAYYNAITIYGALAADKKPAFKKRMIEDYFWYSKLVTEGNMSVRTQETLTSYLNSVVQSCDDLTPEIAGFIANLPTEMEAAKSAVNNMMTLMEDKGCTLSLIHISEPTRLLSISYAVFCLKKKKKITIPLRHVLTMSI
eukprot:TRINITY_DN61603_c0_g1_i1.p1 TRINITY_DN61603_c0_g1~~TRINITY_DN61603_c0_g1_i1.p1  ORF type:complete len:206 (-),score=0.28 TRINITY_DN61603_c0_g1_i1:68-685(-)